MGIKKKCRELNQAKNKFITWLKSNNAEDIEEFEGIDTPECTCDYYRHIIAFIGDTFYNVYFMMWENSIKISYSDDDNRYENMCIDEFNQLILKLNKLQKRL